MLFSLQFSFFLTILLLYPLFLSPCDIFYFSSIFDFWQNTSDSLHLFWKLGLIFSPPNFSFLSYLTSCWSVRFWSRYSLHFILRILFLNWSAQMFPQTCIVSKYYLFHNWNTCVQFISHPVFRLLFVTFELRTYVSVNCL